jgi:uncharacterized Tic20 family protein
MTREGFTPQPPPSPVTAEVLTALPADEDDRDEAPWEPGRSAAPSSEERTLAVLCHAGGYFTWFLMPLFVWALKRRDSAYIDQHGKEALNFQVFMTVPYLLAGIEMIAVLVLRFMGRLPQGPATIWALAGMAVMGVLLLWETVLVVVASIWAMQGRPFRYPLMFRIIR